MGIPFRKKKKRTLFDRSNICGICGQPCSWKNATLDHKVPLSKGGGSNLSNLQIAHARCNSIRGNSDLPAPTS